MKVYTPFLQVAFQIVSTYLFLVILMKTAKIELDRLSLVAAFGLSIFMGYFLFFFVEVLVVSFVVGTIIRMMYRRRKASRRHVPPDLEEQRRSQDE
jgi:predicted branched-subunit amino acid permease